MNASLSSDNFLCVCVCILAEHFCIIGKFGGLSYDTKKPSPNGEGFHNSMYHRTTQQNVPQAHSCWTLYRKSAPQFVAASLPFCLPTPNISSSTQCKNLRSFPRFIRRSFFGFTFYIVFFWYPYLTTKHLLLSTLTETA